MPLCWASCPIQGTGGHLAREFRPDARSAALCRRLDTAAGSVPQSAMGHGRDGNSGAGGGMGFNFTTKARRSRRRRTVGQYARPLRRGAGGRALGLPGGARQRSGDARSRKRRVRRCTPSPGFQKNRFEPGRASPPWRPLRGNEGKRQDQKEVLARRKPKTLLRCPASMSKR